MTDSVIRALVVALEASPGDIGLRAHLSQLLLGAGRHSEALQLAEVGLSFQPSDIGLIRVAIAAGDALGLDVSAHRRALDESLSLAATGGENGTVDSEPLAPPGRTQIPATADELLDTWGSVAAPIDPGIGAFSRPGERLDDVGGMQDAKDRLERSFLGPLRDPHLQRAFGKAAGGGLVLWGPPGCGKTFLPRALAGELGANFYEIRIDDMLDPGFGNSERKVAAVFDFARRSRAVRVVLR